MIEKINESEIEERVRLSRTGKYGSAHKDISGALETEGQPFEVEWVRLPPGKINFPCHAHQVQWEFYLVIRGQALCGGMITRLRSARAMRLSQPPGTAHQIRNASATEDLIYYVIADNPASDPVYYPDSDKWLIRPPGKLGRVTEVDYFDGEE